MKHKFEVCKGIIRNGEMWCDPSVKHCIHCGRQEYDCKNVNAHNG